jgi:hypothetical protein
VSGAPAEQPARFEAALRQVDGQLEALAGLRAPTDPDNPSTVPLATTDLDALVSGLLRVRRVDHGAPVGDTDTNPDSGRIGLAALSGTPVPGPPPPIERTSTPPELPAAAPAGAPPPGARRRRAETGGQHPHASTALARGCGARRLDRGAPRIAQPRPDRVRRPGAESRTRGATT